MSYSIIMNVKNEEEHIGPVLEACLSQSIKPLEIIVGDDASTDSSARIIAKYPVTLINIEPPKLSIGNPWNSSTLHARAFNVVKNEAPGQYILKVDGDTLIPPNYAKNLLKIMATGPPNLAIASGVSKIYPQTRNPSNGAIMYRARLLPDAKLQYAWDRQIWMSLLRQGYCYAVDPSSVYLDLRPPKHIKPPKLRYIKNRIGKGLAILEGTIRNMWRLPE